MRLDFVQRDHNPPLSHKQSAYFTFLKPFGKLIFNCYPMAPKRAQLSINDKLKIIGEITKGSKRKDLAEKYKIDVSTISKILNSCLERDDDIDEDQGENNEIQEVVHTPTNEE